MIEDWRPDADGYVANRSSEREVVMSRERKIDLLDRIDQAEDRLDKGDVTADDLAAMKKDLEEFAPEDIKQRVLGEHYNAPVKLGQAFGVAATNAGDRKFGITEDVRSVPTQTFAPGG
jgi:hypothetical protein